VKSSSLPILAIPPAACRALLALPLSPGASLARNARPASLLGAVASSDRLGASGYTQGEPGALPRRALAKLGYDRVHNGKTERAGPCRVGRAVGLEKKLHHLARDADTLILHIEDEIVSGPDPRV
jgi:hypothetical protein